MRFRITRTFIVVSGMVLGMTHGLIDVAGARAGEPLVSDRPDFTESAETITPGRIQYEGGYTLYSVDIGMIEVRGHGFGEVLMRIGAGEDWEVRVGLNSVGRVTVDGEEVASGLEDSYLGAKYKLREQDGSIPTTALLFGTTVPTGSEDFSVDRPQPDATLAMAWDLTDRFSLGSNLGLAYAYEEGHHYEQAWGTVSLGMAVSDAFGLYLEWFGFTQEVRDGPGTAYLDGGLTFLLTEDVQFDVRYGRAVGSEDEEYFLGAGVVVRR